MELFNVLALFLYFPQDKTEYIPAVTTTVLFIIAAALTMRLIVIRSRKEAEKAKELEMKMKQGFNKERKRT